MQLDLLALLAALASGAGYIVHPDETTKLVFTGAVAAFLALLRGAPPAPSSTTQPTTPDVFTEVQP